MLKITTLNWRRKLLSIAVIGVEPAAKYSFVWKGTQTRRKGKYKAELTLSLRLHVKLLTTAIRAIYLEHLSVLQTNSHIYNSSNLKLWQILSAFLRTRSLLFEHIAHLKTGVTWKFSANIRVVYLPLYFRQSNISKSFYKICLWKGRYWSMWTSHLYKQSRETLISLII